MKTTAAVLHAFGEPHRIEEVHLRDPGAGEVLVRVVAAGICHSDVGQADGEWGFPLPAVLGHEGSGIVEAVGPGVSGVAPGQRVVLNLAPGCGLCGHCLVGRPILCQDSLDAMGEGRLTSGGSPISGAGRADRDLLAALLLRASRGRLGEERDPAARRGAGGRRGAGRLRGHHRPRRGRSRRSRCRREAAAR